MSTATVDKSSKDTERARTAIESSGEATEQAVKQLVQASYGTVISLVPPALTRPTEVVSLVFDVVDQLVGAGRRASLEVARLLEGGFDGIEHSARAA